MRSPFTRDELQAARTLQQPLIAVTHRVMGRSQRYDKEVSISGMADADTERVVAAVLKWLIKRDATALRELRSAVRAVEE